MNRFLILFIVIVFVTVSCAGQKKWTKPDFRQDEFEKDRKDCIQAVSVNPEQNKSVEECLAKKGYEFEPPSDKEKAETAETAKTVGKVFVVTGLVAFYVAVVVAATVAMALIGL
jgi:hypothetical protein